jgi:23S rRNA (pseudouridine1915-N3)-methyltransferase
MKLHIITIGKPKLHYAQEGWQEYLKRLERYHTVQVTHLADKWAYDSQMILKAAAKTYKVALVIDGAQLSSEGLAEFLKKQALESREVSLIVGGPEGLPQEVIDSADFRWSLSRLTFPHDLAMVVLLETLYRASTIVEGHPYHKA